MRASRNSSPEDERSSIFLPPALRRRCIRIEIERATPEVFEATIFSRKWSPSRFVQSVVAVLPGFRMARGLRRLFGKKIEIKVRFDAKESTVPTLHIGERAVPISSIVAIALQGWQEQFGLEKVWDVTLLGPNVDILVGYESYEEVERFGSKLSEATGLPLRESSVSGGGSIGTSTYKISDARDFGPPKPIR